MAGLEENHKKRKFPQSQELEIDVSAPEPPSKKAQRKAKKKGAEPATETPSAQADPERSDYGIWIGNLAFTVTKEDVRKFLTSNCSFADTAITRIHLPRPSDNRNPRAVNKGFAYVDFSNPKAVQEAVGLSEQLLTGRRLLIKDAKSFAGRPEKQQTDDNAESATAPKNPSSKRIFIGNLSFDTTKEALEEHFGQCGPVKNLHMATFQDTGKCKGYAWLEFEQLEAAEAAVKGFVMVNEEEEEEEEESGEDSSGSESDSDSDSDSDSKKKKQKKPKKPLRKRVWVNQLLGRRMRMEFAEDATTRYEKRFGKGKKKQQGAESNEGGSNHENANGEQQLGQRRPRKAKQEKPDYTRYDEDTVQKLSGAIVESQGKKTTFD